MSPSTHPAPRGVTVTADVDTDRLPATTERRGSRILGGLAVFFGGSFTALPITAVVVAVRNEGPTRDLLEGLAYFSVPLLLFVALILWGVNEWIRRETITLTADEVRRDVRSLRGTRVTAEPMAAFEGIRGLERWHSEDGLLHELWLQHPNRALEVLLYRANRHAGFIDAWARQCRALGKPPIEYLAPDLWISRDVDDLGRSLVSLVAEGKVDLPDPGAPPDGIRVQRLPAATSVAFGRNAVILVNTAGITRGSSHMPEFPTAAVDSITVEPGRPPSRKLWLKLEHRYTVHDDNGTPEDLHVSVSLAEGLPAPTLRWLQLVLLRTMAGL